MSYRSEVKIPGCDAPIRFSERQIAELRRQHGANYYNVALLITAWVTLLADSPCDRDKPRKVYNKFFKTLVDDLFGTLRIYTDLSDKLVNSLESGSSGVSVTTFIAEFSATPVFREYHAFTKTFDPLILRFLNSFLLFGSKLYYENPDFESLALCKWIETEKRLEKVALDNGVMTSLVTVIGTVFEKWPDYITWLPKHGSGRVAEAKIWGSNQKNSHFELPPAIHYLLKKDMARIEGELSAVTPTAGQIEPSHGSLRRSKLKFVPKNWKTARSICMEPIAYQWAQQSVRLWVEKSIADGPLGPFVTIQDQRNNQEGAVFGSDFGLVDTIDLSAASDSVRWDLVKTIFPAKVLKYLSATRTSTVDLPDGTTYDVCKFAPMGSALCFPVQSIVYSGIVILAGVAAATGCNLSEGEYPTKEQLKNWRRFFYKEFSFLSGKLQPFRVYGDDIICDTRITSEVVRLLRLLGFVINDEKSFTGSSSYRESCGIHAFDGTDVTPYLFKVKKIERTIPCGSLPGLIDHANRAYEFGYMNLRRHLKSYILYHKIQGVRQRNGVNPILFVDRDDYDTSMAIRALHPSNYHLRRREYTYGMADPRRVVRAVENGPDQVSHDTRYEYQRDEAESISVSPQDVVEIDSSFMNYHYVVWQRSRFSGGNPDDVKSPDRKIDAEGIRIGRRWTPI